MYEERYGPCSEIVENDQLKLDDIWRNVINIAENPDDTERIDFTLDDDNATVITWKNNKRVAYRTWVDEA